MIRILHLADVHFHESTLHLLAEPCRRIVEIAGQQGPDHIVIAGDLTTERGLIDNATAVAVRTFIRDLVEVAPVLVLAGNHDLTYRQGQPNNLRAILADDRGSVMRYVDIVDHPQIVETCGVALCCVPYPSVPTFHAMTGSDDLTDVSARLVDVVAGLRAEAVAADMTPVLVYHGTVEGGRMGDESAPSLRTRGADIALPVHSLGGYAAALCGHLHHPQAIDYPGGQAVYPGCVAPLTFGERTIEPGVELWTIDDGITRERHILPVTHQRLQVEVSPSDWDESADAALNLRQWVQRINPPSGSMVKVKATLPKPRLALLTAQLIEAVRDAYDLHRLVVERTEHEQARYVLDEGADRAARVNVLESLRTLGEVIDDPGYTAHLDDILRVGQEIEDAVEHDHADPQYQFEPVRLSLTNYKQFASMDLDLSDLPSRAGVLGPTGIGKSNLVLAIAAALYGDNPKSEPGKAKATIGDMVRRGETGCVIRLEFRAATGTYCVTRRIRVDGQGRGSSAVYLEQGIPLGHGEYEFVSLNEGTARETQQAIERLVGPQAIHWLTRHLRQHGVSAVKMTSADLADAINATLQLDFEARAEAAKDRHALAVSSRDAAATRAETLRERLTPEALIEAQEGHAKRLRQDAELDGQRAATELEHVQEERERAVQQKARYDADMQRIGTRVDQRTRLARQLTEAQAERDRLATELDGQPAEVDLAALEARVAEASHRRDAAQAEHGRLKDELAQRRVEIAHTTGGLEQSRQAVAGARAQAYAALQSAKRQLDQAARQAALLDEVPCRGESWTDGDKGEMDGGVCPLLSDARHSASTLRAVADHVADCERMLAAADRDHEQAAEAVRMHREESEREIAEREDMVRAAAATASQAVAAHGETERALGGARARMDRRGSIQQRLAPLDERVRLLRSQLDDIAVNDGHFEELQRARTAIAHDIDRMTVRRDQLRARVDECRAQALRAEHDLEQLQLERLQRAQMLQEIQDAERQRDLSERRRLALDYYRRAVERHGIPSLLLEQLVPRLEARINDILAPVDRAVRIATERVTTTGKTRTDVTLSFRSPSSGHEYVPIAELSGGEEDLLNLAFAAGLARVSADMSGTELSFVALDEPASGVSESLQAETLEVIGRIHEHVSRSLVITHRRDLAAAFDAVIEVSQNGSGSCVEVIR